MRPTRTVITALLMALLALISAAWAQPEARYEWADPDGQCWLVGVAHDFEVLDAPAGATLHWDDGTSLDIPAGDGVYSHTYEFYGTFAPEIMVDGVRSGETWSQSFYEYELAPWPAEVGLGEELIITLRAAPDDDNIAANGELDWGDGTITAAQNSGDYPHTYGDPGTYIITLSAAHSAVDCAYAAVQVRVLTPGVNIDPTAPRIDEPVTARVDDEPAGGSLEWGNGEATVLDGSGSYELPSGYADDRAFSVEVRDAAGSVVVGTTALVLTPSLALSTNGGTLGVTVEAQVGNAPENGVLDWGDGAVTTALGVGGSFTHVYTEAGEHEVTLARAGGEVVASERVSVSSATFDVSPTRVWPSDRVTALVGDEPVGGAIDWDDGTSPLGLTGAGEYGHAYDVAGEYWVTLLDGLGGALASELVVVVEPALELLGGSDAEAGESVSVAVSDTNGEVELDWGDGDTQALAGDGIYDHVYAEAGVYAIRLLDAAFGHVYASVELTVGAAEEAEVSIVIGEVSYRPLDVAIDVEVHLSGLATGRDYVLTSGATYDALTDVNVEESLTLTFPREDEYTLRLERADTGSVRATHTLELAWPRASESMALVSDDVAGAPLLAGDFATFLITGLDPGYHYVFSHGGGTGFERQIHGVESWTEGAHYETPGDHEATLTVQYPGNYDPPEVRSVVNVEVLARSGAVTIVDDRVPYGLETTFEVTDLVPGALYRLDLGDGAFHEFTPFAASETFTRTYFRLPRTILLESYVNGGRIWELVDSADPPSGMEMTGDLALAQGGTVAGDVQTFVATGLFPGAAYQFRLERILSATETTNVETVEVTADDAGALSLEVTIPREARELEENTPMSAHLDVKVEEDFVFVDNMHVLLPPLQRTLGGHVVEITELTRPLTQETYAFPELHAKGVVRDFVLGGKVQGDLEFEFLNAFQATITEPVDYGVPARLSGLSLTFTELTISVRGRVGYGPSFAGTGSLAGAELIFDSRGAAGTGEQGEGYFSGLYQDTGELLLPGRYTGNFRVGDTGWVIGDPGASGAQGEFVIDLSQKAQFRLANAGGSGLRIEESYGGWEAVGATPSPHPASDEWMGMLFLGTNVVMRDPALYGSSTWAYQLDTPERDVAISWTGAGFNFEYSGTLAANTYRGWDVDKLAPYRESIVDSRVVRAQPALLRFQVPLFEAPLTLAVKPGAGAGRELVVASAIPVARDFGLSALIADQPRFVVHGNGTADIAFDRAVWTLDQDLAAAGSNLGTTVTSAMRQSVTELDVPAALRDDLTGALAALDTAQNLMGLQLPIDGLTVGVGGDVSVGGETWRTLGKTPELDMYGFPYMSGANADIGIKRDGDQYAIGLRGGLSLGGIVTASAAPSWYYVKDGREQRWVFEGVNVSLGDPNGLIETPATFNLTVGGLVSLADDDASLEFNGAGELTVGVSGGKSGQAAEKQLLNIQVAGVFGINDTTADMAPYWFVYAGSDLAAMGRPIPVKVKGVDVFAFYAFRGGIGHNLRLDQRTGKGANETCAVDDAFVGEDPRPAVIRNALDCFDDGNDLALLAGTVIGWYQQGADDYYGLLWHLSANLTLNSSGQVILGGRGWALKTLDDGYRADATPNMMARISADANGIFGSFCLGAVGKPIGELDCSGLEEVGLTVGGFKLLEAEANAELKASWSSGEYYFAIGRQNQKVRLFIFPDYTEGYFVAGYINTPGIVAGALPASGIWASMYVGKAWDWRYSADWGLCDLSAWATADLKFGGAIRMQVQPQVGFDGEVGASASARAGIKCGIVDTSVGVSIKASGRITAPDPYGFRGSMSITAELPLLADLDVTVDNVGFSF